MRILLIDKQEQQKVSGMMKFSERFVAFAASHGHTVTIVRYSNRKHLEKNTIHIPYILAEPRTYIFIPSFRTVSIIQQAIKQSKPDIVYSYCALSPVDYLLPFLCKKYSIPLASVWHLDVNPSKGLFQFILTFIFIAYLPLCKHVNLLHVFSPTLKQFYISLGVPEKTIEIIPNGVNTSIYAPGNSQFAKKHGITQGILFLGRLTKIKNPELVIQSFLSIHSSTNATLIIVGDGELKQILEHKYKHPRILFTGLISDEKEKIDIMRACSIFLLPSLMEGMSLALLEAMACGLMPIISDAGNSKNVVKDSGEIIPTYRLQKELPVKLEQAVLHPERSKQKGKKAREIILQSFKEEDTFAVLLEKFKHLTE